MVWDWRERDFGVQEILENLHSSLRLQAKEAGLGNRGRLGDCDGFSLRMEREDKRAWRSASLRRGRLLVSIITLTLASSGEGVLVVNITHIDVV